MLSFLFLDIFFNFLIKSLIMSSYFSGYKSPSNEVSSPTDFKKSSVKGTYYTSAVKDPEIEDLKNKYGINSTKNIDKYSDAVSKFDHLQKVSSEISDLRATYNPGSKNNKTQAYDKYDKYDKYDRYDKYDNNGPLPKQNLKKATSRLEPQKPQINLRHTYSSKPISLNYDYQQPQSSNASVNYTTNYRKRSDDDDYKYEIKVQSPKNSPVIREKLENDREKQKDSYGQKKQSKIDFDKINEKLKNNAAMIEQLRKLKQERNRRNQTKKQKADMKDVRVLSPKNQERSSKYNNQSQLNVSSPNDKKRYQVKSFQVQAYTPKYQKNAEKTENRFLKKTQKTQGTLERSKSNYLTSEKVSSNTESSYKNKQLTKDISVVKSSKDLLKKSDVKIIGDFIFEKNLGQGKFGTVFRAFHKTTGAIFAIKKVPKQMIKNHFMIDQFILELKIQSFFNHRNILKIFGFFDDKESIYLILEYMEQGTLFTYFKKSKTLQQADAARKIRDVSQAIYELHESGVAHRDIKPQNIVMSNGVCKLCDFGWATICNERRKTYCGTFDYAAPQILEGVEYDMSVDQWCIGILAYELMVGKAPFYHISRKQTMKKIMSAGDTPIEYPKSMSKKAINFIEKLIIKNPEERMKAEDILQHEFLKIQDAQSLF